MDKPSPLIINAKGVCKWLERGNAEHTLLNPTSLEVQRGAMLAITGTSGCGKSTFLNILACLDTPSSGHYTLNNTQVLSLDPYALASFRQKHISSIFQNYLLIPQLSVLENVTLPLFYQNITSAVAKEKGMELLDFLAIADHAQKKPSELSGGQMQRVSIARALVTTPSVLFADEPTGALDECNSHLIMELLVKINATTGTSILMVTHDMEMAQYCNATYPMHSLQEMVQA